MSYKNLLNKIDELRAIVGGWDETTQSQIETDIALDRIKKIYELLRFPSFEESQKVELPKVEPIIPEPTIQEPTIQEEEEQEEEEEMTLDIDILKSASKERYNKILSLYCDLETQEPILTEEQKAAPSQVVEEVTTTTTTTIKTTASTSSTELYKISSQLGINDRILLANDLFGGDMSALSDALAMFDSFTNIDDVMVYIAENYTWGGDSDGAKLLFTLLQNRFL